MQFALCQILLASAGQIFRLGCTGCSTNGNPVVARGARAAGWIRRPFTSPTHECLGPDDCENLQDRRKPAIQLDKEPAIMVREPDATMQPAPQDNQLMSKHCVLSLKPHLRLEWRGQDGQDETEQSDHSASLGDSITSSTRIRFSVHTGLDAKDVSLEIAN